jgi:hypothetical protein
MVCAMRGNKTYEANVDTSDTAATEVACAGDHLVDELRSVCLEAEHHLEVVGPALCVLAGCALDADVGAAVLAHLLELASDRLALLERREVDRLNVGVALLDKIETPVLVNHDDLGCAVEQREVCGHLSNGSSAPDGNDITLLDASVDNSVPRCAQHIGKVETGLIGNIIGKGEEVDVAVGNTSVFRLATSKATSEVGVSEHACGATTVHCVLDCVVVGLLALRGELLLAVVAITTGNLERCYDTLAVGSLAMNVK